MSKSVFAFHADDISGLARSLCRQLAAVGPSPSHVEMLTLLARSAGYRNFQHFRAQAVAWQAVNVPTSQPVPVDLVAVQRMRALFDDQGRLLRWPTKQHQKDLAMWVLWSRVPPRLVFTEIAFTRWLGKHHLFGDPALLRRWLCGAGLMSRTRDGSEYRRVEQPPPAEARALFRLVPSPVDAAGRPALGAA
jgi:hypothetical protein